jgi:membrane protease YdiL (CAAX protease family)
VLAALMLGYIAVPAVLGALRGADEAAILSADLRELLPALGLELGLFAVTFTVACLVARPTVDDLRLRWRGGWRPVALGLGYSVALRFVVGLGLLLVLGLLAVANGWSMAEALRHRAKVENLVDVAALGASPAYLAVMLTVVSFGLGGLREELWRAAMLAGLAGAAPRWFGTPRGRWAAVALVALAFGAAHTPQGAVGVAATALIGLALGAVILLHRSVWEAVLAHGFFNATSFVLIPLVAERLPEAFGGA